MRKLALVLLVVFGFMSLAQAQTSTSMNVSGQVIDENLGEPLIGVTITIRGTSIGTLTDMDGNFSLLLPDTANHVLEFNYIGYQKATYTITKANATKPITIRLKEDYTVLDEVNVIGYCPPVRKMDMSGSISSVSTGRAKKSPRIRGMASISAPSVAASEMDYMESTETSSVQSGLLTAGEVHDFSKWKLWEDIAEGELGMYSQTWKMQPLQRYVAQLVDTKDMPVIDAKVSLMTQNGSVVWQARTDNTGKAELWANAYANESLQSPYQLIFEYEGDKTEVKTAVQFPEGINMAKMDVACNRKKATDILFIVDATGSMGDEIRYLQFELYNVIDRVKKENNDLELRTGAVFYRDHTDEYLTRKSGFDEDVTTTIDFIKQQRAQGGGDNPEAVDYALMAAIDSMDWREDALTRIAFLILDAPPHNDAGSVGRVQEQIRLAAQKGIRLVPIACSGINKSTEYLLRCMALATNGTYVFLTDDSGIGDAHIKPTTDEFKVEKLNDIFMRLIIQYTETPDCTDANWEKEMQESKEIENYLPTPYKGEIADDNKALTVSDVMIVYPNPCNGLLNVEMKTETKDVYLADISGKLLQRFNPAEGEMFTIHMHNYASGVYFVRAFYKEKWFTFKVILKGN